MRKRQLQHILKSHPATDGAGVKMNRIAMFDQPLTDPFLMLDEFQSENESDYIAGFPSHPHRGMETLSYLLHGSLEHRDHLGHKGIIHSGGAQWMSAGRALFIVKCLRVSSTSCMAFNCGLIFPPLKK